MKKYLIVLLLPYMVIFSQDDKSKNPNVELPDFVCAQVSLLRFLNHRQASCASTAVRMIVIQ